MILTVMLNGQKKAELQAHILWRGEGDRIVVDESH